LGLLSLTVTANIVGTAVLKAGNPPAAAFYIANAEAEEVLVEDGTELVTLTVVPEIQTLSVLATAILAALARRRL